MRTVIGYGSPKAGTSKVHGEPLGLERDQGDQAPNLGFPEEPTFLIPEAAAKHWLQAKEKGKQALMTEWQQKYNEY